MTAATHAITYFTAPGRRVTVTDVLHAADLRGDVPAVAELRPRLDAAAAERASEDWRVEKNLIASEELDVWLAQRQITHDDFLRHFRGEAPSTEAQRLVAWWIEGSMTQMATRHAHALAALAAQRTPPSEQQLAAWMEAVSARLGGETALHDWLRTYQREAAWLADLAQIETAYETCRASLLQPESLAKELRSQHFPLHRVCLTTCNVPEEGTARELMLQLGEDASVSLAEVAGKMGFHHDWREFFIGDLEPAFQQPYLSARPGQYLPPKHEQDGWSMGQIVHKAPPDLQHHAVLSRVKKHALEQGFAVLTEGVIQWCIE